MESGIPSQDKMLHSVENIPVEYFEWGRHPDHYKIEMPHRHTFSELLFFVKGQGAHEIEYIDHKIIPCSIHYIPRSVVHFLKHDRSVEGFTLSFDLEYLEKNNTHKILNPLGQKPFALSLTDEKFKHIWGQTQLILDQIKQERGYYRQKCFLLAIELLLHSIASERTQEMRKKEHNELSDLIRDFSRKVQSHIHAHHNVSWYAQQLHISAKHLSNCVKKDLGVSAQQYIQESLLISVKKDLIHSHKSIKQIAFDHHYDESTLGKLFKRKVECTMLEYRSCQNEKF